MTPGELEAKARAFLGPRQEGIPESVYLKSVTDLVRWMEKYDKAAKK